MKYQIVINDAIEQLLLVQIILNVPWSPDDAKGKSDYKWYAAYNNSLCPGALAGNVKGIRDLFTGYDIGLFMPTNQGLLEIFAINGMFDANKLANTSGTGWILSQYHAKGYNDDNSGWRAVAWSVGSGS